MSYPSGAPGGADCAASTAPAAVSPAPAPNQTPTPTRAPAPGPAAARGGSGEAAGATQAPGRHLFDWRLRFGLVSLIWGFSFLLIKVSTQAYAPFYVTLGRLFFGTAVLGVALAVRREGLPREVRTWVHLAVAGFLLNALPFSLFAFAELTIPSTLAGICNATSPLWGMALSLVALSEDRPTRRMVAGLGIGFLGVLTVLGAWQGFTGLDLPGVAMALLAALSYPVGWIYVRRTLIGTRHSHLALTGGQLLLATVQLAAVTPLFAAVPSRLAVVPLFAVVALGALGTGLALVVQYGLVEEIGPTTSQVVTYFIPVVATVAGVTVLGESLTWSTPVGAAIVLIGAALTQPRARQAGRSRGIASRPGPDTGMNAGTGRR